MEVCTRVGGWIIKPTEKEDLFALTEISTTDSGSTTKLMASVSTAIMMELSTKVIGRRINSTEKDYRPGPMFLSIKEIMSKERSMELAD